jgi:hypothetical protein
LGKVESGSPAPQLALHGAAADGPAHILFQHRELYESLLRQKLSGVVLSARAGRSCEQQGERRPTLM